MDLNESPEHRAYRATVRTWFEQNKPGPLETLDERKAWHRKLYEAGFVGMGGRRSTAAGTPRPMEQAIVAEEMARVERAAARSTAWASASSARRSSSTAPRRRSSAISRRS